MNTYLKSVIRLALALTIGFAGVVQADVIRLSEPVASDAQSETFGATLDPKLPTVSLSEAVTDQWLGKTVLIESRVGQVCKVKGCFFMAMEGTLAVRVSFRDYSFFIPTDSGNKTVVFAGEVMKRALTPEQVAHFKKDAGDTELAMQAGEVFEIVASGIKVPLTAS